MNKRMSYSVCLASISDTYSIANIERLAAEVDAVLIQESI